VGSTAAAAVVLGRQHQTSGCDCWLCAADSGATRHLLHTVTTDRATHGHVLRMTGPIKTPPPTPTRPPNAPAAAPTPKASLRALASKSGSSSDTPGWCLLVGFRDNRSDRVKGDENVLESEMQ